MELSPIHVLVAVSAAAFFFYGAACLFSSRMAVEFGRYRLARFRVLVGVLEILGALGLLVGWFIPLVELMAAAGLTALMGCGLWARWRINDPWLFLLPAFLLGVINAVIAVSALSRLATG